MRTLASRRGVVTAGVATALSLALAACGGGAEEADEPTESVTTTTPAAQASAPAATSSTPSPEVAPSASPSATPTPTPTPSATAAAATVAAKPAEFAVCAACHSIEPGKNGIGPSLAGVFGAKAGHVASFDYSDAMESSGLTWNQANLDRFL
ncbi:MAG TPA: c-type cytochrome, partial [Nonomuraea sp.]|nr:c-type cytochrome [Nonomuraea sp.]